MMEQTFMYKAFHSCVLLLFAIALPALPWLDVFGVIDKEVAVYGIVIWFFSIVFGFPVCFMPWPKDKQGREI